MDWQAAIQAIDRELGTATATRALIAGFVCSWGLTQWLKRMPSLRLYSDARFRWSVRVLAFALGALPTFVLWPDDRGLWPAAIMAVVVGIVAPVAYTLGVRVAVHYWPWLDRKVSARPRVATGEPGNDGGS